MIPFYGIDERVKLSRRLFHGKGHLLHCAVHENLSRQEAFVLLLEALTRGLVRAFGAGDDLIGGRYGGGVPLLDIVVKQLTAESQPHLTVRGGVDKTFPELSRLR